MKSDPYPISHEGGYANVNEYNNHNHNHNHNNMVLYKISAPETGYGWWWWWKRGELGTLVVGKVHR